MPRRVVFTCCKLGLVVVVLAIVAAGVLMVRMSVGPIAVDGIGTSVASALQDRFGRGLTFSVGGASLDQHAFGPSLTIDGLTVKGPDGQAILVAPKATIAIDMLALLVGKVVPKRLEVQDVTVRAELMKNGSLAIAAADGSKPFLEFGRNEGDDAPPQNIVQQGAGLPAAAKRNLTNAVAAPSTPVLNASGPQRAIVMRKAAAGIRQFLDILTDPSSPISAVDRLAIVRGKLVIHDQETGDTVLYKDLDLAFDKKHGLSTFDLSAQGPSRRWSVAALARGRPGEERRFSLRVDGLSVDELQLLASSRFLGFDTDMAFGAHINLALRPDNALSEASGGFKIGDGFIRLDDPDFEPTFIKSIDGDFRWDAVKRQIVLLPTHYNEGATHLAIAGRVTPPYNEGDPWTVALSQSEPGVLGPDRKGQAPVPLNALTFDGRLFPNEKRFLMDRVSFRAGTGALALAGQFDWIAGPHLRFGASVDPTPVTVAERVWPASIASSVRAWILAHFESGLIERGTMKIDYNADDLTRMRADRAPRDEAVAVDFNVTGGRLAYLNGVPPLENMTGTVHVSGRTTHIAVSSATTEVDGKSIQLDQGILDVGNSDIHPVDTRIAAHLSGDVEAVASLLKRDALKPYASLPLDPATLHGHVDGTLDKQIFLGAGPHRDGAMTVHAQVDQFTADQLIGSQSLEDAKLQIDVADGKLKAVGQGRIFDGPASFEIDREGTSPATAQIALTLDDAARAKLGANVVPGVTGPMTAHIAAVLADPSKIKAQVDIDLAKTAISMGMIGLNKPAGKPAKVSLNVATADDHLQIDPLTVDVGPLQARGSVELSSDNAFRSAHFSSLKFSPGDDMKLDVTKSDDVYKLVVRGSTIDARPFLKTFTSNSAVEGTPARSAKVEKKDIGASSFDLDLKSALLTGFNKEVMSGANLKLVRRGKDVRQLAITGRFGRSAINAAMGQGERLKVQAQDAGALLSFIDLYGHMEGGQLVSNMQVGADTLNGTLEIRDFLLRDEPAIRRLVATSTEVSAPGQDADQARRINAGAVDFRRLKVNFNREGSHLELHDATMYGPQIGLSVDGWLDYTHDRVGMKGTFVPVFALNNLFSQIPVFGAVLGGKSNEGLLAITFNISGQASSPSLTINPLSAIAPGFLRNIFGVLDTPVPQFNGAADASYPAYPSR